MKRSLLPSLAAASCALAVSTLFRASVADDKKPARPPVKVTPEALQIHRSAIVIDGHNDLPYQMRGKADSSFDKLDIARPQKELHTDIARLRQGGVGAQFWAAYVPAETIKSGGAARYCLEQIDLIHRMARRYPETFAMAYTAADVERIHGAGKIACLIGIEGGHAIENSLGALRMFYQLGARYITLTHSDTLDWADSATDKPRHGGLSPFGEEVVREMNRLGMLADISHVSADTMRDVLRVSTAPVIASHSSAYALAEHARNVPDDVLRSVAANGGVIMVNFYPAYIVPEGAKIMARNLEVEREFRVKFENEADVQKALDQWRAENPIPRGSMHDVVDHIEHVIKVAGIDHVGLGSDFDGITAVPEQLEDVSTYPNITQELLNRGHSAAHIRKILGANLLRALSGAEEVAARGQR